MAKKAKTNKTKDELYEENLALREEVRGLRGEVEKLHSQAGNIDFDVTHKAVSLAVVDGKYKLIEVGVNLEKEVAKVLVVRPADRLDTSAPMAAMRAKQYLENEIVRKMDS